jgi:hypothetical protein
MKLWEEMSQEDKEKYIAWLAHRNQLSSFAEKQIQGGKE